MTWRRAALASLTRQLLILHRSGCFQVLKGIVCDAAGQLLLKCSIMQCMNRCNRDEQLLSGNLPADG